ncbi:hypothetical protein HAX54_003363 [Datura stramonium]|uniref:Uncharacterized protein n=1 Tax=Datura stramonium TaxID=4076 RepID=A0ABS8T587_DATST|nr:hypothetical protein [Datura stramonium]
MTYFNDDDADATDYLAKLENPENYYTWVTSLITTGTLCWATDRGPFYKSDLNIQAEYWLGFVCSKLTLSKNYNEIPPSRAILIQSQHHNSHFHRNHRPQFTLHRSRQSANLKFSIFGNWDNGIVILFYLPDEVRGRRLRGEIGEATGERTWRNLEEADGRVTGVATDDYGRRRVIDDRR